MKIKTDGDMVMISENPVNIDKNRNIDLQALRHSIIAEYDAIELYEQLADKVNNNGVKKLLLDVAEEEKVHIGEFEQALRMLDEEHGKAEEEGKEEVMRMDE